MIKHLFPLAIIVTLTIAACTISRPIKVVEYDRIPPTKNQNVCKFLEDSVLIYAIFVDVDIYHPWTEFDVKTTMDSLSKATTWLQSKASSFNKSVTFSNVQHQQNGKWTINENKALASLRLNGLVAKNRKTNISLKRLNPWAESISKYAGKGIKYKSSQKMATRFKIVDKQSLLLALRDKYKHENVALLFFVNGFYENHPSYTFFSATNGPDVEYSIITTKNPAVISHEILHLFGAVDLYPTADFPNFNYQKLEKVHPNEIMRIQHKQLEKLNISPITSYFIGWQDTLDHENMSLILHKKTLTEY